MLVSAQQANARIFSQLSFDYLLVVFVLRTATVFRGSEGAIVNRDPESKQKDHMKQLCEMVVETSYSDLPEEVLQHASRSLLDTLAVTIGGSAMDGISDVVDFVREKGGKAESLIPVFGGKVPASEAGLAIGPMARAMDFGDMNMVASHCSEYILPSLLAALGLRGQVSGKEFLTAYVLGQEVLIRVGTAIQAIEDLSRTGGVGGHYIFGCVAAIAKLLGFTSDELEEAQGIAFTMTQPHLGLIYRPPTLMIRVHHGFVCQDAINACLLARRGITGPRNAILSAQTGYLSYARWETDIDAATRDLGIRWEATNIMMKRYPCVASTQGAIDALLKQMEVHGFAAADISWIEMEVDVDYGAFIATKAGREMTWNPKTVKECQFSSPYGLAVAAHTGDLFLDSYSQEMRERQDVRDLMAKMSITERADLPKRVVNLTTKLVDGRQFSREQVFPKGHQNNPLTNQDIVEKFRRCAAYSVFPLSSDVIDSVVESVFRLEAVDDFSSTIVSPITAA